MEISESTWAFIAKHRREDVRDVALHAKHDGDVDVPFALEQIAGWQRASLKLPDWASHDGLIFPTASPNGQCSSQFTAQYKARLAQRLLAEEAVDDDSPDIPSRSDRRFRRRLFLHVPSVQSCHICGTTIHFM